MPRPLRWALQILVGVAVIVGGLWLVGGDGEDSGAGSRSYTEDHDASFRQIEEGR